jgi:superfamily II DNA or RNA helicase
VADRIGAALELLRTTSSDLGAGIGEEHLQAQAAQAAALVGRLEAPGTQILGDPVGTGKTAVSLAAARLLLDDGAVDHLLVVAPNRTVAGQWATRAEPLFDTVDYPTARRWEPGRLAVTTRSHLPATTVPARTLVIVDEAHWGTQREGGAFYQRLRRIAGGVRLLLVSATPYQLSTQGLTTMLGLSGPVAEQDGRALAEYGRLLAALVDGWQHAADLGDHLPALAGALRRAERVLAAHLLPPIAIDVPDPPPARPAAVPVGSWGGAYEVARLVPEMVGAGRTDAYQRMLCSSSEAVRSTRAWEELRVLAGADTAVRSFAEALDRALGTGADHPKVAATASWAARQAQERHVLVFCHWRASQQALADAISARTGDAGVEVVAPRNRIQLSERSRAAFTDPEATPRVVLVVTDEFSESIDLDGGRPALVHHDLVWSPVRLRQRWGRVVRIRSGFETIPADRIHVPVLDVPTDRRLARTVQGRERMTDLLLPDEPWELPDRVLAALRGAGG